MSNIAGDPNIRASLENMVLRPSGKWVCSYFNPELTLRTLVIHWTEQPYASLQGPTLWNLLYRRTKVAMVHTVCPGWSPKQEVWRDAQPTHVQLILPSSPLTEVSLLLRVSKMERKTRTIILKDGPLYGNMSEEYVICPTNHNHFLWTSLHLFKCKLSFPYTVLKHDALTFSDPSTWNHAFSQHPQCHF